MRSTWSDALDSISEPTQAFISFMGSFLFRSAGCRFGRIIRTFLRRRRVFADNSSGQPDFFRDGSALRSGGEPRREKERKNEEPKARVCMALAQQAGVTCLGLVTSISPFSSSCSSSSVSSGYIPEPHNTERRLPRRGHVFVTTKDIVFTLTHPQDYSK